MLVHVPVHVFEYQEVLPSMTTTACCAVSSGPRPIVRIDATAEQTFGLPVQFTPAVAGYTTPGVQPVLSHTRWA